jgi:hypothetical protein
MIVLGLWVCDGERERESDVGLLLMKALVLERKVETVVVRLAGN